MGIVALSVDSVSGGPTPTVVALTKKDVLQEYKDCFDKIGRFPSKKYKIKQVEDATPVVHPTDRPRACYAIVQRRA